jgi:hypothetical protein
MSTTAYSVFKQLPSIPGRSLTSQHVDSPNLNNRNELSTTDLEIFLLLSVVIIIVIIIILMLIIILGVVKVLF